jgi:hypothetical protein
MTAHREHIRIRYFAAAHAAASVDDELRFIARRLEAESIALDFSAREVEVAELAELPRRHLTPATSALGMTGPQRCSDPSNRRGNPDVAARQGKHFSEALGQTARKAFRFSRRSRIQIDCNAACFTVCDKDATMSAASIPTRRLPPCGYTVGTAVSVRDCWQDTSRWR